MQETILKNGRQYPSHPVCIHYTYFMCTYIYVLNIPIFCAIWLRKCDFLTEKLGIKFIQDPDWPDPDPKWFIPDPTPDPAKSSGSDRIRIHNPAHKRSQMQGGADAGSHTNEYNCAHGAKINSGYLTPYLTYAIGFRVVTKTRLPGQKYICSANFWFCT